MFFPSFLLIVQYEKRTIYTISLSSFPTESIDVRTKKKKRKIKHLHFIESVRLTGFSAIIIIYYLISTFINDNLWLVFYL